MKKLRSNLPRRKRTHYSPLLIPKLTQNDVDSYSNLTREVTFSCDSSTNNNSLKKRSFADENGAETGEFRRITRSCNAKEAVEVSESPSCVDQLCNSSSNSVIRIVSGRGNDVVSGSVSFRREVKYETTSCNELLSAAVNESDNEAGIESSEVTMRSECSVIQKRFINGRDNDNDVVSGTVTSRRDLKFETTSCFELLSAAINDGQNGGNNDVVSVLVNFRRNSSQAKLTLTTSCFELLSDATVNDGQHGGYNDAVSVSVSSSSQVKLKTTSCFQLLSEAAAVNESQTGGDNDAVSVSVTSPETKFQTTSCFKLLSEAAAVNESQHGGVNDAVSVSVTSRRDSPQAKLTASCFDDGQSVTNKTVNEDDETELENCGESKLNLADIDLTCSEQFSFDEESDYSSAGCTDAVMESSEVEFSSDFATLSWYDSGSQFSERSVGDPVPSPTFQLFLIYRQKFCKSEFSTVVASEDSYNEASDRVVKLLRPEDEEHEESYQMMKRRERRQVYLHDYAEEYCVMKEYGDLAVHQRLQMVHWIMEQSANKDLQKETMFLGVNLFDRFLSKGYFRSQMELEIAGIACLTLATRIEENQPYNSFQQTLFNVGRNEYSRSEVVAMEWLVQEVLNFQCYLPTIYNFLWFYLKAARSDEGVDKTAKYLAVLALLGHEQLCYWPSTVAASLVSLACLAGKGQSSLQQITWIHNGSNDKDLPDCIKSLEWLVQYI
ncbi:uncharacterized protein LOC143540973 [Bidens hawaiensis]|uniref:uncharacterized protein LOC143540973 n=1 Tax=Bidens hawaiensis TaxID=980011 RepID=UPI0040493F0D